MPSWISGSISGRDRLAAELVDGLLHHLGVELEADRGDVPALLLAEQVAGAADLEVVRGDLEAAAEIVELLQHLKAHPRLLASGCARRESADTRRRAPASGRRGRGAGRAARVRSVSARSMKIVFAFGMSSPDSMIVVHSSTSNSRAEEVRASPSRARALASGRAPTSIRASGTSARSRCADAIDRLDPVVDEEHLAAAVAARAGSPRGSRGRRSGSRRCGSPGGRAAASRSPTDRGCRVSDSSSVRGIGVAVSVSTSTSLRSCLMRSLSLHAEAMLLVDDQQAETRELDVALEQAMRADDDVDLRRWRAARWSRRSPSWCGSATASRCGPDSRRSARWKVSRCCCASTVVGTRTATCWPSIAQMKAARIATSVLP